MINISLFLRSTRKRGNYLDHYFWIRSKRCDFLSSILWLGLLNAVPANHVYRSSAEFGTESWTVGLILQPNVRWVTLELSMQTAEFLGSWAPFEFLQFQIGAWASSPCAEMWESPEFFTTSKSPRQVELSTLQRAGERSQKQTNPGVRAEELQLLGQAGCKMV